MNDGDINNNHNHNNNSNPNHPHQETTVPQPTKRNNVIVMSEAGKPIFARYGTETEISRQCGLFQAIRTAVNAPPPPSRRGQSGGGGDPSSSSNSNKSVFDLGEIQSLHSNNDLCIVFMTVGSITLVSIIPSSSSTTTSKTTATTTASTTEAFARLQLEYIYAQLIFTLTEQVQNIFVHNPSFDLRTMLTSSDSFMHGILDDTDTNTSTASSSLLSEGDNTKVGPYLVSGVQSVFPISPKIRDKTSKVLQTIGGKTDNTAFALLVCENKLLSLVQPSYRPHQIRIPDLHLVLNFVTRQPGLYSNNVELWIPMCLPRFNSSGFLYAYCNCFDIASKLTLILISSHNTTEQFQLFRDASMKIRQALHIPAQSDSIITVRSSPTSSSFTNNNNKNSSNKNQSSEQTDENSNDNDHRSSHRHDIEWTREESFDEYNITTEDDFVNILSDADLKKKKNKNNNNDLVFFLKEVRDSIHWSSSFERIYEQYLGDGYDGSGGTPDDSFDGGADATTTSSLIHHFLFRVDIPVKNCSKIKDKGGSGHLTQCKSPPVSTSHFPDDEQSRLWYNYQKLNLRLRLGSATVESSMDAFDMISQDDGNDGDTNAHNSHVQGNGGGFPGIGKHCPAIGLLESPPNLHGVTYIVESDEIFLAMNGRDFELYMVAPNSIPIKQAAAVGTKLVRRLMADQKRLFLSTPLTWKE